MSRTTRSVKKKESSRKRKPGRKPGKKKAKTDPDKVERELKEFHAAMPSVEELGKRDDRPVNHTGGFKVGRISGLKKLMRDNPDDYWLLIMCIKRGAYDHVVAQVAGGGPHDLAHLVEAGKGRL